MQPPTAATVLGDFDNASLTHFGVTTTFRRQDGGFIVRTDGADGTIRDFEVVHTFGIYPLQQYLIAGPGGRLQVLGIAWDSRPSSQGGQRWFHLYPDQALAPGERLHWTGRDQTWNTMCADCHTTALRRGYDAATDAYTTTWQESGAGCESCHGPGAGHVGWARAPTSDPAKGLAVSLRATDGGVWEMTPDTGIARRSRALISRELDACAGCHSRRKMLRDDPSPALPFLDTAIPSLLTPGLYHADGQVDGEVFEWGSFVQSRMHRAGVVCSNCHEPHGLGLRAEGNAVCAQCHAPERFETATHHHHAEGGAGAQCAACHMPSKLFMGVDRRHDHSFRIPRPDLSVAIGVPNACTSCHSDRPASWAAETVAAWFPAGRHAGPHFGLALEAGRRGAADAEPRLNALIRDRTQPAIARATALGLLAPLFATSSAGAVRAAANDADPLVRMAAPGAVPADALPSLRPALWPLLADPVRAVRVEAARALAATDPARLSPAQRATFEAAFAELLVAEQVDADRPETQINLGLLWLARRDLPAAEAAYRTALRQDPGFAPALVNLADLQRQRGRETEAIALLGEALARDPANADALYALGLAQVRTGARAAALETLRRAAEQAPGSARNAMTYALALREAGRGEEARSVLERTHQAHPADRDTLLALVAFARADGDSAAWNRHARALMALDPANPEYRRLLPR